MLISQSVFGLLCSIKHTDLELYLASVASFDMSDYIRSGSYTRDLISFEHGKIAINRITVTRIIKKGDMSRRSHSILPDIIIPCSSYSIRFILTVIYCYQHRNCSADSLCHKFQISRSTLHDWIRRFSNHIEKWLTAMKMAEQKLSSAYSISYIPDFARCFLDFFGFPFLTNLYNYRTIVISPEPCHIIANNKTPSSSDILEM